MYAIGQIIYGVPLCSNDFHAQHPATDENNPISEAVDNEEAGFLAYYSGSAEVSPYAFGVELGQFDECCSYVSVRNLPLQPTQEQRDQYQALYDQQPQEIKAVLDCIVQEPEVFILWSTS